MKKYKTPIIQVLAYPKTKNEKGLHFLILFIILNS